MSQGTRLNAKEKQRNLSEHWPSSLCAPWIRVPWPAASTSHHTSAPSLLGFLPAVRDYVPSNYGPQQAFPYKMCRCQHILAMRKIVNTVFSSMALLACKSEKCEFSNCILSELFRLFHLNIKVTFEISGKKTTNFLTDCPINHPGEDQPYQSKKVKNGRVPFIYLGYLNFSNINIFLSANFALHLLKL